MSVIYVGIDDTDVIGSRGTNQIAKSLVASMPAGFRCVRIVRHQLLMDPRVPFTSKNGSASVTLEVHGDALPSELGELAEWLRAGLLSAFVAGSDPGLCVAMNVPATVVEFGRRCQRAVVMQREAWHIAANTGIHLAGLGGSNDGVIGALAAVGLAATGNDGRVVQLGCWPDDLSGVQPIESLHLRGVSVQNWDSKTEVTLGQVDVGKRLRPNRCCGRDVLFVRSDECADGKIMRALKLP